MKYTQSLVLMASLLVHVSWAQENDRRHSWKLSTQIGNNILSNGRKMSKDAVFIKPSLSYYHDNGFYASANLVYLPSNKKRPVDSWSLNTGYDKDFGEHLTIGIDYTYSYYLSNLQVASSAANTIMASASWYNRMLTPTVYGIWNLGSTTDFTLNIDLNHIFKANLNEARWGKLTFPVSLGAYFGSSYYYINYAKLNTLKDRNGKPLPASVINPGFGATAAYLMGSARYRKGNFSIGTTVIYNVQVRPLKAIANATIPVLKLTGSWYF